jgi:uncharacterized cupredoxin-like copper-binding protein
MRIAAVVVTGVLLVAGCGGSGHTTHGSGGRTIDVEMRDIAYAPDRVSVKAGESVQFVFHNTGKVTHDAFVGDEHAQLEHESAMSTAAGGHHGDSSAITVEPGKSGTLTRTFAANDDVVIGCHEPGHYEAGMKLHIDAT